jgi:hypothetical protein
MSQYTSDWTPADALADEPKHREIRICDVIDPRHGDMTFYRMDDDGPDTHWITVDSECCVSLEASR